MYTESMINYLSGMEEDMPQWLKDFKPGDFVPFSVFMQGRIGYYPGSGYDVCLIETANRARCVHQFLHVDYYITRRNLNEMLSRKDTFMGYHLLGNVEWTADDLLPNGKHPFTYDIEFECDPYYWANKDETPYCFMCVFESDSMRDDYWGAERFAVTFLFDDGIMAYYQLFVREYKCAPWLFLLQDHGFGLNYDKFGKDGMLDHIIRYSRMAPQYVICADNTCIWDSYRHLDVHPIIGGMHRDRRELFVYEGKKTFSKY